jgi:hypothetical protein
MYRFRASPFHWREKAADLKHAAELLWPECERQREAYATTAFGDNQSGFNHLPLTHTIYLALAGFSTECLLKGTILKDNHAMIENGKMNKTFTTHDLLKLAQLAKISLSNNERIFCKQAVRAMTDNFRYPVSKRQGSQPTSFQRGGNFRDDFNGLYDRLYPNLNYFVPESGKLSKSFGG